ncbi:hypothetical protein [Halobaculum rubrum]|uniref:hypothetical protein n=1 Tax=Halobaculum rubrum TaxID=2872158 RepID=UPI001CA404F5|nr:hypothetical protein [Halobaculum rubrum]QZY01145.1 hypothetical protein K6T25_13435 [Halobaculum rubrum]
MAEIIEQFDLVHEELDNRSGVSNRPLVTLNESHETCGPRNDSQISQRWIRDVLFDLTAAEGSSVCLQHHSEQLERVMLPLVLTDDGRFGARVVSLHSSTKYNTVVDMSEWVPHTPDQQIPLYGEGSLETQIERTVLSSCPEYEPDRWIVSVLTSEGGSPKRESS